jgi:transcriptional regulator with XRE-family HTH domain
MSISARDIRVNPLPPKAAAFGDHLRAWRQRRRLSQLDLASHADISTRHLSYVETGRANPSREMVLRLTARLEVPPRERNTLTDIGTWWPSTASWRPESGAKPCL